MMSSSRAPASPQKARAMVLIVLKVAAAILLTSLALRKVDFAQALAMAKNLPFSAAVGAMALLVLQAFLAAFRWELVSRHTSAWVPFWSALRLIMISLFYTQALPSTLPGDAVRIWGASRFGGRGEAAVGVFLDRLLTLLALLLLATVSLGFLAARGGGWLFVAPDIALGACFVVLVVAVVMRERLSFLLPGKVGSFAVRLAVSTHRLFTSADSLGLCFLSVVIQGLAIVALYVLARGLGLPLTPVAAFMGMPVILLAALLPISVNGWGVREGAMMAVLAGFGIGRTEAATLSVIFGLFQLVLGLAGGLFVLFPEGGEDVKA